MSELSHNLVKSDQVIGREVVNLENEDLGIVEELVLNKQTGETAYVVLSFGGIMGLGDKYFALPWSSLTYNPKQECFVVKMGKEELKNAPGFDKNNWPNMADPTWQKTITTFYADKF